MRQIKIETHGLLFIQADIHGCDLPSRASIECVMEKITDKRKKRKICEFSNSIVSSLYHKYNLPIHLLSDHFHDARLKELSGGKLLLDDIDKILLHITVLQCRLSGDDYYRLIQNFFNVEWFEALFGDFNYDIQKLHKVAKSFLSCTYGKSNMETLDKYNNMKPEIPSSSMIQYPEYMAAKAYSHAFDGRICKIALHDERMSIYMIASIEIMDKVFEARKKSKNDIHKVFCTKCQKYFTSERMPILKVCRPCQNKQIEEKKIGRRIDRKGWAPDRIGACQGGCVSLKKQIDTDGICWDCHENNDLHQKK